MKYTMTQAENDFVKKNFGGLKTLISYCDDYILLRRIQEKKEFPCIDMSKNYSSGKYSDDYTTGIICGVEKSYRYKRVMNIMLLVDGEIRWVAVDLDSVDKLLSVQKNLNKNPKNWSQNEIDEFEFIMYKPFVVQVFFGLGTLVKPLRFDIYDEALSLYEKIVSAEMEE